MQLELIELTGTLYGFTTRLASVSIIAYLISAFFCLPKKVRLVCSVNPSLSQTRYRNIAHLRTELRSKSMRRDLFYFGG